MPSDISDCKRKNQCFKTRIRNDFTEKRSVGGIVFEALGIIKMSETKPRNVSK